MRDSSNGKESRELRKVAVRLRQVAKAQAQRSQALRAGSAAALAKAVILRTVFVARHGDAGGSEEPPVDHPLFSPQFLPRDRRELLETALQCAKRIAGTPLIAIELFDGDGALRIEAHSGLAPAFLRFFDGLAATEYLGQGEQRFVADVASDPLLAGTGSGAVLKDAGIASLACTPIVHEPDLLIGLLSAYYREPIAAAVANLPGQQSLAARMAEWLRPELIER